MRRACASAARSRARSRSPEIIRRMRSISATPTASRCARRCIAFGGDPEGALLLRRKGVAAFVEAHIEQGPRLEAEGLPLGVVTAINGATRLEVGVDGVAGHAGATPMSLRRDALTAAAETTLAIEERARREPDLVATVGRLEAWPGATNVIPGHVQFSIDIRAPADANRARAVADIEVRISAIAAARRVSASVVKTHEANAFACDAGVIAGLTKAVEAVGVSPRLLPSGAGHDTMAIGKLCPAGMLFIRCKGGVSHNPLESITVEDCAIGLGDPVCARLPRQLDHRHSRRRPMSKRFFGDIGPVRFEGLKSDNSYAYRHYDPSHKVMGKTMAEHLQARRLLLAQLRLDGHRHVRRADLRAPLGRRDDEGRAGQGGRGVRHVHDPRLSVLHLPRSRRRSRGRGPQGVRPQSAAITDLFAEKMQKTGVKLLWGTANLFSHPRYMAGAATNPDPDVFAYAAAQVKNAIEATHRLGRPELRVVGRPRGLRDAAQHRSRARAGPAWPLPVDGGGAQAPHRLQGHHPGRARSRRSRPSTSTTSTWPRCSGSCAAYGLEREVKVNIEVEPRDARRPFVRA